MLNYFKEQTDYQAHAQLWFDWVVSLAILESNEFILYAVRNSIHRYDLATGTDQALPLIGLREAVALDFDYDRNCLYWADISLDNIQV